MPDEVMNKFISGLSAFTVFLVGHIWRTHNSRIADIESRLDSLPVSTIEAHISTIKNDIDWIKSYLLKK
jgi:hypothetical protein